MSINEITTPTPIATIEDRTGGSLLDLQVGIEPVQNLNGYDYPWAGGGGKNKLNVTNATQTINDVTYTVNSDGSVKANGTATANSVFYLNTAFEITDSQEYIFSGCTGGAAATYRMEAYYRNSSNTSLGTVVNYSGDTRFKLSDKANCVKINTFIIVVMSGATVNNVVFKPMVRLASVSDSSFAPYANVCPITGFTEAKITRAGKNLMPNGDYPEVYTVYGITFTKNADGSIKAVGTATANTFYILCNSYTFKPGTYRLSGGLSSAAMISMRRGNTGGSQIAASTGSETANFTFTENTAVGVIIRIENGATIDFTFKPMLRLADSEPGYEPYYSTTYPVSFSSAGTVYGGTLDVNSGVLTVDTCAVIIDGTTVKASGINVYSPNYRAYGNCPSNLLPLYNSYSTYCLSDKMETNYTNVIGGGISSASTVCWYLYSNGGFYVTFPSSTGVNSVATANTWFANNTPKIVYKLQTPQTYQLTQTQVSTILNQNNIWSDTGKINYLKGGYTFHDKLTSPVTQNDAINKINELVDDYKDVDNAGMMSFVDKTKLNNTNVFFGTCATAAATASKIVTLDNATGFNLSTGTIIGVKFVNSNSASNVTLNVNSSGAKSIVYNTAVYTGNDTYVCGRANNATYYMFDGTYWRFLATSAYWTNTYDRTLLTNSGFKAKSAITGGNLVVADSNGEYFHLKSGSAFDITYPMIYASGSVNAGAVNDAGYLIVPLTVTTTQAITLTANKMVYVKGTLSGSTFTPVSTTPLTQTIPTTDDGYYYYSVGKATTSTIIYLYPEHPIFVYKGGKFIEYVGYSGTAATAVYAVSAGQATKDGSGNQITTTYAVKGSAEYQSDTEPYLLRQAPYGNYEVDKIVGGTIAWNQIIQNGNFTSTTKWTPVRGTISASSNILTYTVTELGGGGAQNRIEQMYTFVPNHVYLFSWFFKPTHTTTAQLILGGGSSYAVYKTINANANVWTNYTTVQKPASNYPNMDFGFKANSSTDGYAVNDTAQFKDITCFDLTQMFGSTIADYIYSLETATAGAGVAYFRKLFPKPYYEYDSGSLKSVNAISHAITGLNQLDTTNAINATNAVSKNNNGTITIKDMSTAAWSNSYLGYSDVVLGKTYTVEGVLKYGRIGGSTTTTYPIVGSNIPDVSVITSDAPIYGLLNKNRSVGKFTSNFTGRIYWWFCSDNSLSSHQSFTFQPFVHFDLNGEYDGQYEPYEKLTYPLDSNLTLRGIPKLDANNKLYYDGDTYENDGTVTRRYGVVDLGTLTWTKGSGTSGVYRFIATTVATKSIASTSVANVICSKYNAIIADETYTGSKTGVGVDSDSRILICDSAYYSSDAAAFKTAMSGVYLVYELASPTIETAASFGNPQSVSTVGTEEYVVAEQNGVAVPVGHETRYGTGSGLLQLESAVQEIVGSSSVAQATVASMLQTARNIDGASFDGSENIVHYGTCNSPVGNAVKEVTLAGNNTFNLVTGAWVAVKFTNGNTYSPSGLKLNVAGSGEKSMLYRGAALPSMATIAINRIYFFVYDGTNWEIVGDLDTNTQTVTGVKGNAESSYRTGNVNLTPANIGAVALSGSTMNDNTTITFPQTSSTDAGINVSNASTGASLFFGIGTGQENRGIFDRKLNKWILYADASNVYLNGNADTSTAVSINPATTPTTLNMDFHDSKLRYYLAERNVTTGGKPPVDAGAFVLHMAWKNQQYDSQLATNGLELFTRTENGDPSIWSNWTRYYNDYNRTPLFEGILSYDKVIPANANLNSTDYLATGYYACVSDANATTLTNSPVTISFTMIVSNTIYNPANASVTSGNYIYRTQEITTYNARERWIRYCKTNGSGTWTYGSWIKEFPVTDITGNAATATTLQTARTIDGVSFNGSADIMHFGGCTITGTGSSKKYGTVFITGFTLATGAWAAIYFPTSNSTDVTDPLLLTINNTTGKPVKYYRGSDESIPANANVFCSGRTYLVVYDGTNYRLVGDLDTAVSYDSGTAAMLSAGTVEQDCVWTPKILHDYIASTSTSYSAGTDALLSTGTDTSNRVWQAKILHDYMVNNYATRTLVGNVISRVEELESDTGIDLPTTWITPTVTSSSITISEGGYYKEGRHCFVQMRFKLASALSANSGRYIASAMPEPLTTAAILSIAVNNRGGHNIRVLNDGRMQIVADTDHAIATTDDIDVTGVYTIAVSENSPTTPSAWLANDAKTALLQLAEDVAYINQDGQDDYNMLYDAFYPPAGLVSISAVYTQSGTVYDTDTLNSLKPNLVVTGLYDDQTTRPVTTYILSGTLTTGTSTITVSFGGKTTTFTVTVTHDTNSYVTNGLFAHWDAIDNQATGTHSSTATTWVDKINGYTWIAMKTDGTQTWAWQNNGLNFTANGGSGATNGANTFKCARPSTGLRTLEIVFTPANVTSCLGEFTSDTTGITDNTTQTIGILSSDNTITTLGVQNGYNVTSITSINSISATYGSSYAPVKAYKNGEEITTQGSSHSFKYHYYTEMILGSQNNSTSLSYGFKGVVHSIRMYNRELTASEIAQNYAVDVARFNL